MNYTLLAFTVGSAAMEAHKAQDKHQLTLELSRLDKLSKQTKDATAAALAAVAIDTINKSSKIE